MGAGVTTRGSLTILVFAKDGKVEHNGEGRSIRGEDDELGNTTVQRLGSLVGTLLELASVWRRLLVKVLLSS